MWHPRLIRGARTGVGDTGSPDCGGGPDRQHPPAYQQRDGGQPNGTAATAAAAPSRNPVTLGNGQAVSAPGGTGAWRGGASRSGSVEAQPSTHLVLVHDRVGVAAGDAGVVGEPVG